MKKLSGRWLMLLPFCFAACGAREEVATQPPPLQPVAEAAPTPPAPPPPPPAAFDPNDRERTYRWIAEEATAFRLEYLPAKEAVEKNPLNDELLKEFIAVKLPAYRAKFEGLVGRDVAWKVKVHSIDQEGVIVEADEHITTEPYTGSGKPLDYLYINLFIENGKVNEEIFMERRKLKLGKQITREYAKTLGARDVITVKGRISKVGFKFGDKQPPGWIEITLDDVKADPPGTGPE